uniref:Uncharacterized protein n=1 Tax=Arundo donax TaxID=35708 RepID=A0A0A8ZCS9_ARUDO
MKNFKAIWVCASTRFDAISVTTKILESLTEEKPSADRFAPEESQAETEVW